MVNRHTKAILSIILIGFLVLYPAQIARSAGAIVYVLKEFTLDVVARVLARTFLGRMDNAITEFISKNGRDDAPNFIQNWRDFLANAQYRGEDATRAIIGDAIDAGSGTICQYLRNPLGAAFGASKIDGFNPSLYRIDSLQYYKLRNRCTLPAGFNIDAFRNDFAGGGGWTAWNQLIQPQNNVWGVVSDTLNELTSQRVFEEKTDQGEANSGGGFTSKRSGDKGCVLRGLNTTCLILGEVLTPADMFKETAGKMNSAEFNWLTSSDELSEVIAFAASWVTDRLSNLAGASTPDNFTPDTARGTALQEKARQDCIKAGENTCTQKAKKLDCDASASGGDGGSGGSEDSAGSGGSGGSANVNCVEVIDQGIYNSCMAEVNNNCTIQ
ncbi:MAG: hypothetical protein HYT61_00095 [Candidatus Yanofskybacteria bacterium]|nr:hypothetical protein [Candidatus Yanofskybacteria bacterium]